ncbi:MAG: hypothetical protein KH338_09475, partial [Oscillospiraceae bacterium]|nr:hypothetical protein [Oscillospiraceae bacterium]
YNQIQIWCFVFVTLFNLQGAHRSQRREFILPHRFRLVKNFFQVFQPFFVLSDAPAGRSLFACRLSRRLTYFSTSFSLCQELFSGIFSSRFVLSSRTTIQKYLRCRPVTRPALPSGDPSRKRLAIIANPASFVKNFFRVFSAFSFVSPWRTFFHRILSCTTTSVMIPSSYLRI